MGKKGYLPTTSVVYRLIWFQVAIGFVLDVGIVFVQSLAGGEGGGTDAKMFSAIFFRAPLCPAFFSWVPLFSHKK